MASILVTFGVHLLRTLHGEHCRYGMSVVLGVRCLGVSPESAPALYRRDGSLLIQETQKMRVTTFLFPVER